MKAMLSEMLLPENRGKFVGVSVISILLIAIAVWQIVGYYRGGADTSTPEYQAAQEQIKANAQAAKEMAENDPNKVPDDWKPKVTGRGAAPMPR